MGPNAQQYTVHRLTVGRAVGFLVVAAVVVLVLDITAAGRFGADFASVCLLLALAPLAYVLGLRPAVLEGPAGIEVRNPMRTTVVPWTALTDLDVVDVLRLQAGDRWVRCFAVPRRRPPLTGVRSAMSTGFMLPPKDPGRGWQPPSSEPRAAALMLRLREMAERARVVAAGAGAGPGVPSSSRLAPDAVVAVGVALALVVVAAVLR